VRLTDAAAELLGECGHLHVSGASLFSAHLSEMTTKAVELVKSNGGSISFDPNIRKEVARDPEVRAALETMLEYCDTFLPSGEELTLLTRATTPEAAIREILGLGVTAIVVKNGAEGATYHDANGSLSAPGYPVDELDPTGAGDCSAPPSSPAGCRAAAWRRASIMPTPAVPGQWASEARWKAPRASPSSTP